MGAERKEQETIMPKCTNAIIIASLILACLISLPGTGQDRMASSLEVESRQPDDGFKIKVDVNLVTTDVSVIGNPAARLQPEDFKVFDNHVAQQVAHFSQDQLPLAIALLIDSSESIRPYLPVLQIAANTALRHLRPGDQIALYSFNAKILRLADLTDDRFLISDKASKITVGLGTDVFGTAYEAAAYLRKKAPRRRRAIILVSDNCHQPTLGQLHSPESSRTQLLETSTTLYDIRTPGTSESHPACLKFDPMVKKLAEETGGEVLNVQSPTALMTALEKAVNNLRMQYTIGFNPSAPGETGSFHRLDVKLAVQDRCPGCRLLSRSGYYSGVPPPLPATESVQPSSKRPPEKIDRLLIERSILTAGQVEFDFPGIQFAVATREQKDDKGEPQVKIDLQINPAAIAFKNDEGRHTCKVRVAVFYASDTGRIYGSDWRAIEGQLSDETYNRVLQTAIPFSTVVPLKHKDQILKIVIYDEESDAIGSKLIRLHMDG